MIKKFSIVFLVLLAFISCKKENSHDCFKSNGSEISEIRVLPDFTSVETNDKIETTIMYGTAFKVEVIAGKNISPNIITEVKEGVLKIDNRNKCNFVRGYKKHIRVNITMPYLYSALNNGVATLTVEEGFGQDSIRVRAESSGDIHLTGKFGCIKSHSNGNGDIYLSGSCSSLYVYINGTNFLKAEDLNVSDYIFVQTLTQGDCFINGSALDKLEYIIYNAGNIYYKGIPKNIKGSQEDGAKGQAIQD